MALATNLGFPRIGAARELKKAMESFWAGKITEQEFLNQTREIKVTHWRLQYQNGLSHIPSNDFSFYDHVLDTAVLVGAVPTRYAPPTGSLDLAGYFSMARGRQEKTSNGAFIDVPAMEMTKWFDTNYHYIVPEFKPGQTFQLSSSKPVDEFKAALAIKIKTRPVLVGPFTFLKLGKSRNASWSPLTLMPNLIPIYQQVVSSLAAAGAEWIQIDEPALAWTTSKEERTLCQKAYQAIKESANSTQILLTTYFEGYHENLGSACRLPVDALHLDIVRCPEELDDMLRLLPDQKILSMGVVDGRNIWRNDFSQSLALLEKAKSKIGGDRIMVAPSCSLLHTPVDLNLEVKLKAELKNWMAFARQKIKEIVILTEALNNGVSSIDSEWEENVAAIRSRATSPLIHNPSVQDRVKDLQEKQTHRKSPFATRQKAQHERLGLPFLPTTTIGSFPQTTDIRSTRRAFKEGTLSESTYKAKMRDEIAYVVKKQEEIGLDVLVHGEPERNDMVEYFGERLSGFAFTENGWVQSYGSRCVKPPFIFGDVARPQPMTLEWTTYAQSLTQKPMKGMLTGPITILQWSFVRDDQPRSETAKQIALAIRDEVMDLEKAGIEIIQIDEAAIREGLPIRKEAWAAYFDWSVSCFRIASSGVEDTTQIHTHMCYSEFNDMIEAIAAMDADVITIEASRSGMELLDVIQRQGYPNDIGPGVYDIHSPRVPSPKEIEERAQAIMRVIPRERVWINPDCGLKTRHWPEVEASLKNMVFAARELRKEVYIPQ